ncbi:hypothetical protein BT93_H1864 [Corymbia citriodora subsp. variegata]|nr:hypothetical protein BT93_H1864 [Corymbia citriodora subsp. variegata]
MYRCCLSKIPSASSREASILRRTNPTVTPTRTRSFMMAAIQHILLTALYLEERAPPPLPFPCDLRAHDVCK